MQVITRYLLAFLTALFMAASPAVAVDVNRASVEQLQEIKGVGPKIAERIVRERRNGAFKSAEDLKARVKGVGDVTADNIMRGRRGGVTTTRGSSTRERATGKVTEVKSRSSKSEKPSGSKSKASKSKENTSRSKS